MVVYNIDGKYFSEKWIGTIFNFNYLLMKLNVITIKCWLIMVIGWNVVTVNDVSKWWFIIYFSDKELMTEWFFIQINWLTDKFREHGIHLYAYGLASVEEEIRSQ